MSEALERVKPKKMTEDARNDSRAVRTPYAGTRVSLGSHVGW